MTFMHSVAIPGGRGGTEALTVQLCQPSLCPVADLLAEALASSFFSSLSNKSAREASKAPESLKLLARLGTVWPCSRNSAHFNKHLP